MIRINSGSRTPWSGALAGSMLAAVLALAPSPLHSQSTRLNGDVTNDAKVDQVDAQAVLQGIVDVALPAGQDLAFGDANCDGRVTAIDAQIILMKAAELDVSALCVARAVGSPVATIVASPATGSIVANGYPLQLTATALDPSNAALSFRTIIWSSSDVSKATVTQAGLVQGLAAGAVQISATNGSVTTIIPLTVVPAGAVTLTVSPSAGLVDVDRTAPLAPEIRDAANNVLPDRIIVWKSSDPKIAAVNASTGLVTGVKPGTVTITADAGNGVVGSATVTVLSTGAVTRHWKGTASTDWNDVANWVEGAVPVPTDTVQIPASTPHVATISGTTIIGGIKVLKDATMALGSHELQVTGRIEVDGQITGTGRVNAQGLSVSTTYIRGTLPNLTITGQSELVDNLSVTGSLEINTVSALRLRGRKATVAQNLTVRGGLMMSEKTDTLDVRGNARFVNDQGGANMPLRSTWATGTFRLGGNLTLYSPAATSYSPLVASGTNRIILNGTAPQVVADTGVDVVALQELDISSAAVEFRSHTWNSTLDLNRFRFSGRVVATIASTISGNARVNALDNLTTAGGTVSLRNLAVRGLLVAAGAFKPDTFTLLGPVTTVTGPQLIPAGSAYQYKEVVVAGIDRFAPGSTGVPGDLTLGCLTTLSDCVVGTASLTIGGNSITIGGNVRQTPLHTTAQLIMDDDADKVLIKGGLLGPVGTTVGTTPTGGLPVEFTVTGATPSWTKGVLSVNGDVAVRGPGVPASATPYTHEFIMVGAVPQNLRAVTLFNFNSLTLNNSSTGGIVLQDTTLTGGIVGRFWVPAVRRNLTIRDNTKLSGNGRINVLEDVQTLPGSSVILAAVQIGAVQRVSGTWTVDTTEYAAPERAQTIQAIPGYKHILVTGKASFGGNSSVSNGLTVAQNGELNLERRSVTVTGASSIAGILRMQDIRDTLTIDGNLVFNRIGGIDLPLDGLVTAGVLKVTGNISGSRPGGFYPTGTHKTIWSTGNITVVSGHFNDLEVATKILGVAGSPQIQNANIHGALIASGGQSKLSLTGNVVVDGPADLSQADTVFVTGTAAFTTSVKVRKFQISLLNLVTAGNVEVVDGGEINGQIIYTGQYTEGTSISKPELNKSMLLGLASLAWKTQPSNVTVNTAMSPAPVLELRDAANKLLVGTQYITISPSTGKLNGLTAPVRFRVENGVLTLTDLKLDTAGGQTLTARVFLSNGVLTSFASSAFTVNP